VTESNFWAVKAFGRYFHLSVSRRSQRQQQNQTIMAVLLILLDVLMLPVLGSAQLSTL
jgi:hypothetical protein